MTRLFGVLVFVLIAGSVLPTAAEEIAETINACQGEGCGCFQGYREALNKNQQTNFPIKTIRPFTLYERMDKRSKEIGRFKADRMAQPLGYKSLVLKKGLYIVENVKRSDIPLKPGDKVDTLFSIGEGFKKLKKSGKWVEFFEDDIKLLAKSNTTIEGWLELSIEKMRGFTQDDPFEGCLE